MQVLAGDVLSAQHAYWHYFGLWQMFGALPERFLYPQGLLHPNQQQYPLRPELLESTFYLYQVCTEPLHAKLLFAPYLAGRVFFLRFLSSVFQNTFVVYLHLLMLAA